MASPRSQRSQAETQGGRPKSRRPAKTKSGGTSADPAPQPAFDDILAQFRHEIERCDNSDQPTLFETLISRGVQMPSPKSLTDEELSSRLKEVIHALARFGVYLTSTDHLSDRQLYAALWTDVLHVPGPAATARGEPFFLDMVGSGFAEDIVNWLRYYADDESRALWQASFPDEPILPREKPPFDRDRHLPRPKAPRRPPPKKG
ncbi:MAG: hypothetical protein N2039_04085 [Gemmataceae bacterium]|nr:hypothetical protein [Gemmataceae bacterium]